MPELGQTPSAFWQGVRANHHLQHESPAIKPGPRNEQIPLSFGQERLWLVDQLQPGTPTHNLRAVFRFQGRLNPAALEKSLQEIVRRHEILRTRFPASQGQPIQVISSDLISELPLVNLENLPPSQREAEAHRLAAREAQQAFDLAQGPLLRFKLLRLAEDEYILLRTIHHIINDRWSDSVFIAELAELYQAFVTGKSSPLPELPIQYADFALFQRQWLQGDVLNAQLDYWRQQLGGHLAPLNLPAASATPAPTYQGGTQYLTLTPDLTKFLQQLGYQAGVSLFVVLLAVFKTLLYQYSGQAEISLCSPVAGRNRPETKKLIGYFNNLVLLRTSFREDPSFREVINRVSQVTLGAFEHQDLPLQHLADTLNIPGSILAQAMFALQNVPDPPLEMAGVKITLPDMPAGLANFDLSLSMKMKDEHLLGVLRYKTDLFQEATATRLLENFRVLLQNLVANPGLRLSDLPRLTPKNVVQGLSQVIEEVVYVAPQSELEHTVAAIWQELLQLDRVSIEANFFDLGGRSLTLVQVGSKLQEALNREIPFAELFKQPTIRRMAQYLSRERDEKQYFVPLTQQRAKKQLEALKRQKQYMQLRRNPHG